MEHVIWVNMSAMGVGALEEVRGKKEGFAPENRWELEKTRPGIRGDVPTERPRFKPNFHSLTLLSLTLFLVLYRWNLNWSVSLSRTRSWS